MNRTKHMLHRRLAALVASLLAGFIAAGCGAERATVTPAKVAAPAAPLALPVRLDPGAGSVEARTPHGGWAALPVELTRDGLTGLRTTARGAVLTLGADGTSGTLWLDRGTEVALGSDARHQLVISLARGRARLSLHDLAVTASARGVDGAVPATGRDVLLLGRGGAAEVVPTPARPAQADWSVALSTDDAPAGVGTLEAKDPTGSKVHLTLISLAVDAERAGDMAATTVEHVFDNPSDQQLEGTFRFPVPRGAAITGLAMEIDGKLMEGELVERDKARRIYDEIVDSMQDPALLEWEQGNVFKLRVFPIEPHSTKRVVLRYLAPLERGPAGWRYSYHTAAPAMQERIDRFRLTFDGREIAHARGFSPGGTVDVPLGEAAAPPAVMREVREDGVYTAVRVRPDWSRLPAPAGALPDRRARVVVFDTSRSSLESRDLALETLRVLLADLGAGDRFVVLASDVTVRPHHAGFVDASPAAARQAIDFVAAIEPDGASDLVAALSEAGKLARVAGDEDPEADVAVLYLGDGTATWGVDAPEALRAEALAALGRVPLHAVALGRHADADALEAIAGARGGVVTPAKSLLDVHRFALRVGPGAAAHRLTELALEAPEGVDAFLLDGAGPTRSVARGDEVVALLKTAPGAALPESLTLNARLAGEPVAVPVRLASAVPTAHVARRWVRQQLARMQREGAEREAIVALSLAHGVMSRFTAFLVLESEEAYERYQIERKKAAEAAAAAARNAPQVSGADLESLSGREASLSPDHIQPGDPELRIPAPADARSVIVVFPFGDVKEAVYEPALDLWTARFLIDNATPDGRYTVRVRIAHADGRIELFELSYTVDTLAPDVEIKLLPMPKRPGEYMLYAKQKVTELELTRAGLDATGASAAKRRRMARMVTDARRVDVQLPDGTVVRLKGYRLGRFRKLVKLDPATVAGPLSLRVVSADGAGNQATRTFTLDPTSKRWQSHDQDPR